MAGREIWYFMALGQQVGPISFDDVKARIGAGEIKKETHVWREGLENWIPAADSDLGPCFKPSSGAAGKSGLSIRKAPPEVPRHGLGPDLHSDKSPSVGDIFAGKSRPSTPIDRGMAPGAVWSFISGLMAIFICGLIFGIIAITKGRSALEVIGENPGYSGKGLAIAGIILGILGIIGWALVLLMFRMLPAAVSGFMP